MNGSADGAMRFGFSTSLRDVARYAAEAEARRAAEQGLGLAPGLAGSAAHRTNPFDVWVEGRVATFRDNRSNHDFAGHFSLITVGADTVLSRSLLVGTMIQFDSMHQHSSAQATEVSGRGWLAGPYATVRLTDHVFWQSRAAWGRSSNDVSPFLTYIDKFETERWLVSSTLAGRWDLGPWVFRPSASLAYIEDAAKSYTDTFGVIIPEVKSRLGQAKAGPEIGYRYKPNPGVMIEPHAGLQVIWNFAGEAKAIGLGSINGDAAGPDGVRGRAEIGLRATTLSGILLGLSGSYDGIGAKDYDAFTGRVTVRVPLN